MSEEHTTTELQELRDEVERLKTHNEKLLAEKKKATSELSTLQETYDTLSAKVQVIDEKPIMDVYRALTGGEALAGYLRHAFESEYKLSECDGEIIVTDTEGEPIKINDKPCPFTAEGVRELARERKSEVLDGLILLPVNSGGGSNNARGSVPPYRPQKQEPKTLNFGLK